MTTNVTMDQIVNTSYVSRRMVAAGIAIRVIGGNSVRINVTIHDQIVRIVKPRMDSVLSANQDIGERPVERIVVLDV